MKGKSTVELGSLAARHKGDFVQGMCKLKPSGGCTDPHHAGHADAHPGPGAAGCLPYGCTVDDYLPGNSQCTLTSSTCPPFTPKPVAELAEHCSAVSLHSHDIFVQAGISGGP